MYNFIPILGELIPKFGQVTIDGWLGPLAGHLKGREERSKHHYPRPRHVSLRSGDCQVSMSLRRSDRSMPLLHTPSADTPFQIQREI